MRDDIPFLSGDPSVTLPESTSIPTEKTPASTSRPLTMCRPRAVNSPSELIADSSSSTSSALSTAEMSGGSIARERKDCRIYQIGPQSTWLDRRSYLDVVVHNFERQCNTLQRYTLDFWDRERRHTLLLRAGVKLVADAGLGTPSTSATLFGGGAGDPLFGKLSEACFRVVVSLFNFTAVYHIDNVVDGNGSLWRRFRIDLGFCRDPDTFTSATFVEIIIFHSDVGAKTRRCSSLVKLA